jgi:hypothetical protein
MRRTILIFPIVCLIVTMIVAPAGAQTPYRFGKSTRSDVEFHTTNYGIFGRNVQYDAPGFTAPRGSGANYIGGSGLWFGAKKKVGGDTNKLAFITYNPNSGASWGTTLGASQPVTAEALYHSVDYDMVTGQPLDGISAPPWPLWLFNGTMPHPGSPGYYVPEWSSRDKAGDLTGPAFMPGVAEQFVARFNDQSLGRYENMTIDSAIAIGYPLGLDIQQNIFAWDSGPFKDVVMVEYAITNNSSDILLDCVVAQITDPDVGLPNNDHARFFTRRPDLRAGYAWTETALETRSYKVLATAVVEAPVVNARGAIDRFTQDARKRYHHEGRLGAFQCWPYEYDYFTPSFAYDYMTDHSQFDPGLDNAFDMRMLTASEEFTMYPNDVAHFTVVYCVVDARPLETSGSPPSELETLLESINDAYYNRESFVADVPSERAVVETDSAILTPNPARDRTRLRFTSNTAGQGMLRVVNGLGQEVLSQKLDRVDGGVNDVSIDLSGVPAGLYFVSVSAGSRASPSKLTVVR